MRARTPLISLTLVSSFAIALAAVGQKPAGSAAPAAKAAPASPKLDAYKKEASAEVDSMHEFTQQMVDQIFSYGELGFQEFETSKYLTGILEKNGFTIDRGLSGIPTA